MIAIPNRQQLALAAPAPAKAGEPWIIPCEVTSDEAPNKPLPGGAGPAGLSPLHLGILSQQHQPVPRLGCIPKAQAPPARAQTALSITQPENLVLGVGEKVTLEDQRWRVKRKGLGVGEREGAEGEAEQGSREGDVGFLRRPDPGG